MRCRRARLSSRAAHQVGRDDPGGGGRRGSGQVVRGLEEEFTVATTRRGGAGRAAGWRRSATCRCSISGYPAGRGSRTLDAGVRSELRRRWRRGREPLRAGDGPVPSLARRVSRRIPLPKSPRVSWLERASCCEVGGSVLIAHRRLASRQLGWRAYVVFEPRARPRRASYQTEPRGHRHAVGAADSRPRAATPAGSPEHS
jgi:hypothetical protein